MNIPTLYAHLGSVAHLDAAMLHAADRTSGYHNPSMLLCASNETPQVSYATFTAPHASLVHALLDGYFFNHEALCNRWGLDPSCTDCELLACGFSHEGADCFSQLHGPWSAVLIDTSSTALHFARDPLGQRPLFFTQQGAQCSVASQLATLITSGSCSHSLNYGYLAEYMLNEVVSPLDTPWLEIQRVAPGYRGVFKDSVVSLARFWQPSFNVDTSITTAEAATALRAQLDAACSFVPSINDSSQLAVSLSGGLDSSCIAIASRSSNPILISLTFDNPKADESEYIKTMQKQLSLPAHTHAVSLDLERWLNSQLETSYDVPSEPNCTFTQQVRSIAKDFGCTRIYNGLGGDELCTGWCEPRESVGRKGIDTVTRVLLRHPLSARLLRRAKRLAPALRWYPRWCTEKFFTTTGIEDRINRSKETIATRWREPAIGNPPNPYQRYVLEMLLRPAASHARDCEQRESLRDGVRQEYPFLTTTLVEFILGVPQDRLRGSSVSKGLLRQAFADMLPATILQRTTKAEFSYIWDDLLRKAMKRTTGVPTLEALGWVDNTAFVTDLREHLLHAEQRTSTTSGGNTQRRRSRYEAYRYWRVIAVDRFLHYHLQHLSDESNAETSARSATPSSG